MTTFHTFLLVVCCVCQFSLIQSEKGPYDEEVLIHLTHPPGTDATNKTSTTSQSFAHGFIGSFSMIVFSEIGDKTFFIAAIMAMKHSRLTVFSGAMSALALMTVLSVFFGWAATIIPRAYTYYIATASFIIFGLKMIRDGLKMSPNEGKEEFDEVQADLLKREDERAASNKEEVKGDEVSTTKSEQPGTQKEEFEKDVLSGDVESGNRRHSNKNVFLVISRIILQAFTLTFLAEWGDRSQISTIILATTENVYGVTVGGILGHAICTGMAVIGGRFVAQRISVRTVTIIGGFVFLLFAMSALFFDPNGST